MALFYRTVKDPKLAVFASTFTSITRRPEVVQVSPYTIRKLVERAFYQL